MFQVFGYISAIVSAFCYLPYIRDILRLKTKPERASWFIWTILGSIAFFTQLAKGATNSLWLTGVETVGVTTIFLLSIKFGSGGFKRRDIIALVVAFMGLIVWMLTKEAAYALLIIIGIDGAGAVLTVIKAYEDPESETMITWLLAGIAGIFSLLSVGSLNMILLIYPFYIFVINFAVVIAMHLGKQRLLPNKSS